MQEELKEKDSLRLTTAETERGGDETLNVEQGSEVSFEISVAERKTCVDAEQKSKSKASSISDPDVGKTVDGRYRLLENVGKGGSSSVYRARELESNRAVALKVLHSHLVSDDLIVERFKREAETSKFLQHPNVIDVESWSVSEDGQVYMTAEFVEGISLQEAIKETGCLSVKFTLGIMAQVCLVLAAAHEMGIVHCDLKPGNIMLTRSPDDKLIVKVLDR